MSMTTRADLHRLVDQLPEAELEELQDAILKLLSKYDPLLKTLLEAPEDDEPETEEERQAVAEAYADFEAGRWLSHEEAKRQCSWSLNP